MWSNPHKKKQQQKKEHKCARNHSKTLSPDSVRLHIALFLLAFVSVCFFFNQNIFLAYCYALLCMNMHMETQ